MSAGQPGRPQWEPGLSRLTASPCTKLLASMSMPRPLQTRSSSHQDGEAARTDREEWEHGW
jgi:hypothetical protein